CRVDDGAGPPLPGFRSIPPLHLQGCHELLPSRCEVVPRSPLWRLPLRPPFVCPRRTLVPRDHPPCERLRAQKPAVRHPPLEIRPEQRRWPEVAGDPARLVPDDVDGRTIRDHLALSK